ncbi:MAG: N(5)-(carboxyethyl)ornithine synthase [Firmicutes bacterium]|jgi:N5-(carboxyethyl)ornithine synthase|nr:N(5)-(carboxyethyl)ornithine synthase [Bacillota bacterium]
MKTIGFVISTKNNEKRRAILPKDLDRVKNTNLLYFEEGYAEHLGFSDEMYQEAGANVASLEEVLKCDIIVDVKLGDALYLHLLKESKMLVGWAHAVQNIEFTSDMMEKGHTVVAWEEMFEDGRYIFYRNREIAGEAAILHAYQFLGKMPYETKVAILGNGQTAKGALRVLHGLGARVDVYDFHLEKLFLKNMGDYDVLVNCILWDTNREDRIIYREDLQKLKKGSMIIDVSCNNYLEIETSGPTTIDDPVYEVDGIIHYAVDNTPAMFPHTVTNILSEGFAKYVDKFVEGDWNEAMKNAIVIEEGKIIDEDIRKFRERRGL